MREPTTVRKLVSSLMLRDLPQGRVSVYLAKGESVPLTLASRCYVLSLEDEEAPRDEHPIVTRQGCTHLGTIELFEDVIENLRARTAGEVRAEAVLRGINYYLHHDAFLPQL